MRTDFDIGDIITLQVTGKVVRYSAEHNGDCYTVSVNDGKGKETWLYFSGDDLKATEAHRIAREIPEA